jgi:hypothetical protein
MIALTFISECPAKQMKPCRKCQWAMPGPESRHSMTRHSNRVAPGAPCVGAAESLAHLFDSAGPVQL